MPAASRAIAPTTAASATSITLTWADNSNNETGFKIERSFNGGAFTQIFVTAANATTYSDTGTVTIYAGCGVDKTEEVVSLALAELRSLRDHLVAPDELRRAKDHLKGSLMLSLENTASRMSHLARQEIYFDRQFGLDETLVGIERVTREDVQRVAADLFKNGSLAATVLGNVNGLQIPVERLDLE